MIKLSKKTYRLSFFLYFLLFGVLVEIIAISMVYVHNYRSILKQFETKYKIESSIKKHLIQDVVAQTESSIKSISDNSIFLNYISDPTPNNKNLAQCLFFYISHDHQYYMQIRYIDNLGNESIRVDKNSSTSSPIIIKGKDLQNKANRYYFKDTIKLGSNKFWYSKIDLNVENKKIEIPHKPTLRVARRFFYNGEPRGIIIINLLMKDLLSRLIQSSDFNIDLVDAHGNYIYSFSADNSWSVDLGTKKNILKDKQIEHLKKEDFRKKDAFLVPIGDIVRSNQNLFLVFTQKDNVINAIRQSNIRTFLWIMFLVLITSIPIAILISSIPLALQRKLSSALVKIHASSRIIDRHVMTLVVDEHCFIRQASTSFCSKLGYTSQNLLEKHCSLVINPNSDSTENEQKDLKQYILFNKEMDITASNGRTFCVECTVSPVVQKDGDVNEHTIIFVDITEKKEIEKRTTIDHLTKLYNRLGADKILEREFSFAQRYKTSFSVAMVDIDFFKKINDTYGHQAGDSVLIQIAKILQQMTRQTDSPTRFGGEEFLIILPQTNENGAYMLAQNLRKKIENFNFLVKENITASFGVASFCDNDTIQTIIKRADEALYEAKNSGRNKVLFKKA